MNKTAAKAATALALVAGSVAGYLAHTSNASADVHTVKAQHCTQAPTSAKGYATKFASLGNDWKAADVSISVEMGKQRVWLFGDTFSLNHGMVNSSAVVQCGGNFHVSDKGNQLLPEIVSNDGHRHVYWIESAKRSGVNTIDVKAAEESIGASNSLDFHRVDTKRDRVARLTVSKSGNVKFTSWEGYATRPKLDTHFLTVKDGAPYQKAGHLFYGKVEHNAITFANGSHLVTICQNRIGGEPANNYAAYRPVYSEVK